MAQLSGFWTTSGAGSGDQQVSYTQAQLAIAHRIIAATSGFEGVAPGYLNMLAPAGAGSNTVSIATGGAMVDGLWYINDASLNVNVPSAISGTRIDRIVLRAIWGTTFTVRIFRIEGTASAPAITQNSGNTYDIQLCRVSVTTGGAVTVVDERRWAGRELVHRQGGSATVWHTAGSTNYIPGPSKVVVGSRSSGSVGAGSAATVSVTFLTPFAFQPIVAVTPVLEDPGENNWSVSVVTLTSGGFTLVARNNNAGTASVTLHWRAEGPQ